MHAMPLLCTCIQSPQLKQHRWIAWSDVLIARNAAKSNRRDKPDLET